MTPAPDPKETPWHESFFSGRALVKVCNEMGECAGFFSWLAEHDPALYNRIEEAWDLINCLWLSQAETGPFKDACKSWYILLMEAKKGFEAWKAKQAEESRQPAQKAMALQ